MGVLQGDWKLNKGLVNGKSAITLENLIQHECVGYLNAQDDPCDCARWILASFKVTKVNLVTVTHIIRNLTEMCHICWSYQQNPCSFVHFVPIAKVSWQFLGGWTADYLDVGSVLLKICFVNNYWCIKQIFFKLGYECVSSKAAMPEHCLSWMSVILNLRATFNLTILVKTALFTLLVCFLIYWGHM